jgi:hypothetical protein
MAEQGRIAQQDRHPGDRRESGAPDPFDPLVLKARLDEARARREKALAERRATAGPAGAVPRRDASAEVLKLREARAPAPPPPAAPAAVRPVAVPPLPIPSAHPGLTRAAPRRRVSPLKAGAGLAALGLIALAAAVHVAPADLRLRIAEWIAPETATVAPAPAAPPTAEPGPATVSVQETTAPPVAVSVARARVPAPLLPPVPPAAPRVEAALPAPARPGPPAATLAAPGAHEPAGVSFTPASGLRPIEAPRLAATRDPGPAAPPPSAAEPPAAGTGVAGLRAPAASAGPDPRVAALAPPAATGRIAPEVQPASAALVTPPPPGPAGAGAFVLAKKARSGLLAIGTQAAPTAGFALAAAAAPMPARAALGPAFAAPPPATSIAVWLPEPAPTRAAPAATRPSQPAPQATTGSRAPAVARPSVETRNSRAAAAERAALERAIAERLRQRIQELRRQ